MAMIQALGNVSKVRGALDLRRGHRGGDAVLPRRDRAAPPVPHAEVRPVRRDAGDEPVADRGRLRLGRAEGLPTRRRRARDHRRQPPPRPPAASRPPASATRTSSAPTGASSASCGIRRATRSSSTSRRSSGPTSTPSGCPGEFAPELRPPRRGGAHRRSRCPGRGHRDRLRSRHADTAGQRAGRDRAGSVTVGGRPLLAGPIRRGRPVAARRDRPVPARPVAQVDRQRPDHAVARRRPRSPPPTRRSRSRRSRSPSGLAVDQATGNLVVASVVKLKPGVFSDEFFRDWRDSFDEGVCGQAGGVTGNAQATMDGRTVYIGTCEGGVHTYHVHLEGPDVIVSRERRRATAGSASSSWTPCPTDGRTGRAAAYPRTDDRRSPAGRRRPPRPRPARPGAELPRLGPGSRAPDADEQPRPGGRREPRRARRLRRDRPGGAELGGVRRDRPRAARARRRRDAARPERQAGRACSGPTSGRRGC